MDLTRLNINEIIRAPDYKFLYEHPNITNRIMFVVFGGSHAYGTNNADSDVDIRGCVFPAESDLLGITHFEQYVDNATDSTVYSFPRLFDLLCRQSPSCIEMLGCRKEDYALVSDAGQLLLDNRKLFLSQDAISTFDGYARSQLHMLKHFLARDRMDDTNKEEHILECCERAMEKFHERYAELPEGSLKLYIDESTKSTADREIFMDVDLRHYPLRDYVGIWDDLRQFAKNYGKLNARNRKKDDKHLNKHMMHLVRLKLTLLDILEKGDIITHRGKDYDLLMDIRNGVYMTDTGLVRDEFYEMLAKLDEDIAYAKKNTDLPQKTDAGKLNDLSVTINRMALNSI